MIGNIIFLCAIALASCQYPLQRAPPLNQGTPPEAYADYDDYAPSPRQQAPHPRQQAPHPRQQAPPPRQQAQPQPAPRQNTRRPAVFRPATVHYVNIGPELAGDYKFGYDTGKGDDGQSFREETRLPDGTVQGSYGYVDETGKQRIVKYRAGKDGFKVVKDGESDRAAPARQAAPAPQQTYRASSQQTYAPEPQTAYRQTPQPRAAYRPPAAAQPAYRSPPAQPQQPANRAPPAQPQQPAYRAKPAYSSEPQARPRSQAPRPQYSSPPKEEYDESQDYDYPNNDISVRRLVPVDTSLFNYNIGTSHSGRN